jgi:hypothetical protein
MAPPERAMEAAAVKAAALPTTLPLRLLLPSALICRPCRGRAAERLDTAGRDGGVKTRQLGEGNREHRQRVGRATLQDPLDTWGQGGLPASAGPRWALKTAALGAKADTLATKSERASTVLMATLHNRNRNTSVVHRTRLMPSLARYLAQPSCSTQRLPSLPGCEQAPRALRPKTAPRSPPVHPHRTPSRSQSA